MPGHIAWYDLDYDLEYISVVPSTGILFIVQSDVMAAAG